MKMPDRVQITVNGVRGYKRVLLSHDTLAGGLALSCCKRWRMLSVSDVGEVKNREDVQPVQGGRREGLYINKFSGLTWYWQEDLLLMRT
jgi:hypothetical protein